MFGINKMPNVMYFDTWSTAIVTPVKPDGTVRICGDYKCTINKALRKHAYPIPAFNQFRRANNHHSSWRFSSQTFAIWHPGIFQNVIDKTVAGIQGVLPYFDDILIAASEEKELANRLETVLHRFAKAGLRLKSDKCKFCLPCVEFLGFEIDATGINPAKVKVQAVQDAPASKNKQQLQVFLGLLNFYHSFLKDKATVAEPLHPWTSNHEKAFRDVKRLFSSDAVLTHYDGKKPLVLVCDASQHGIGAVLCHKLSSMQEISIAFYSRTLSTTKRNYAQIDKEAFAVIAGKETPQILSPRMLRWSILLNAYDYTIIYRAGKEIANADALSRLPKQSTENNGSHNPVILLLETIDNSPLHSKDIAQITAKDLILTRVLSWAWRGWPKSVSDERLKPYVTRQHEISIHNGIAHRHPGIVQMKALARSYVWWPKMDSEIENLWESPRIPWFRIHVDLAGPIYGKNFLIVVDAFSKWLEVRDKDGINHITSAPFHPSSNGQAERMVRTTKEFINKMTQRDWEYNLTNVLFCQHVTPCTTTDKSPNELLMNRRLQTVLDRLQPDVVPEDLDKKFEKVRPFQTDDQVYAKNYSSGKTWKPAIVVTPTGPLSYQVQTEDVQRESKHRKTKLVKKQLKLYLMKIQQLSQHQGKKLRQRHHHLLVKVLDNRDRLREKEDRHNGSETTNVYAYRNIYKKNAQEHITVVSTSPVSVRRCVSAFARCALFLCV
ncbi:Transposon Ty3-I Gag-Pol polyprotein [Trichinella britovi]|uniref:RNA-directed DNA polymerase n=1 Tax=Trichinella britovi TaxID=45882 RepID=A0A0V1CP44_TRIBR|nr:Transposon Ty3-I Gag-Pol polyprotein [Trichinella britovi]